MAKPEPKRQTFQSILDRPSVDAKRPRPLPVGHYTCRVTGLPREDKSAVKGTDFVEFTLQPIEAGEDVDKDELATMGGIKARTVRATYYLTDDAEWRLAKFLDDCGMAQEDEDGEKLSHSQRIADITGAQVVIYLKHKPSDDGTMFANIASTQPVAD